MDKIFTGDSLAVLQTLESASVQTCVTSPPYFGLRDYGHEGQIGLEETPEAYVAKLVELFREVKRVLKDDGTLWLNLGDSYNASPAGNKKPSGFSQTRPSRRTGNGIQESVKTGRKLWNGLKQKDLIGIPWRVAFALQADGWYLRQDIIWAKPNPMPESVTDRCTKSHEYIFLLSKSPKYYFDNDAIKEPAVTNEGRPNGIVRDRVYGYDSKQAVLRAARSGNKERKPRPDAPLSHRGAQAGSVPWEGTTRNRRSVWTVNTKPYKGAHFATFPTALIEPCILAGAPKGGVVLDPFFGSGTTGAVAKQLGRQYIGIELNPAYVALAEERLGEVQLTLTTDFI